MKSGVDAHPMMRMGMGSRTAGRGEYEKTSIAKCDRVENDGQLDLSYLKE